MTADELEVRIEKLIAEAREAGMVKGMIVEVLHDVAENLQEEEEQP